MTLHENDTTKQYATHWDGCYETPYAGGPMQPHEQLRKDIKIRVFMPSTRWFGDVVGIRDDDKWFVEFDDDRISRVNDFGGDDATLIACEQLRIVDAAFERAYRRQEKALYRELGGDHPFKGSNNPGGAAGSPARAIVEEHLRDHPEDYGMSERGLARKLGVSATPVHAVFKEMKEE